MSEDKMHYGKRMKNIRQAHKLDANMVAYGMNIRPSSYHYLESSELLHLKSIRQFCEVVGIPEYSFFNTVESPEALIKVIDQASRLPVKVQEYALDAYLAVVRGYSYGR